MRSSPDVPLVPVGLSRLSRCFMWVRLGPMTSPATGKAACRSRSRCGSVGPRSADRRSPGTGQGGLSHDESRPEQRTGGESKVVCAADAVVSRVRCPPSECTASSAIGRCLVAGGGRAPGGRIPFPSGTWGERGRSHNASIREHFQGCENEVGISEARRSEPRPAPSGRGGEPSESLAGLLRSRHPLDNLVSAGDSLKGGTAELRGEEGPVSVRHGYDAHFGQPPMPDHRPRCHSKIIVLPQVKSRSRVPHRRACPFAQHAPRPSRRQVAYPGGVAVRGAVTEASSAVEVCSLVFAPL